MLFLMNDVVLNVDLSSVGLPLDGGRLANLRFEDIGALAGELYAREPLLHRNDPMKAVRLAGLITAKAPQINAALFVAPARNCKPEQVAVRYAQISFDVLGGLFSRQQEGSLTTVHADQMVWRRLAA